MSHSPNQIIEYGFSYCQYSYSLPRPLSELFRLFMQINYGSYFKLLGFVEKYYDEEKKDFDFEMKYFNADGGLGSMCGNGGRCAVKFAEKHDIIEEPNSK